MVQKVVLIIFCVPVLISEGFFSECRVIMAVSVIISHVVVIFIMIFFVIVHCRNMHDIAPHGAIAAEARIFSLAVVQEGSPED